MKIGEMFVEVGLKGGDVFSAGLDKVKNGFGAAAHGAGMFLDVSKRIAGLMASTVMPIANAGAELYEFERATGISMVALQQWQHELMQFGVTGDEVQSSMHNLQRAINNMIMGGGIPKNMALIFQQAGIDLSRIRDTTYLFEKLRDVSKTVDVGIGQTMFESLGLSYKMFQGMVRSTGDISKVKGNFYSPQEGKRLEYFAYIFKDIEKNIERAFGKLTAKYGPEMLFSIEKIILKLIRMVEILIQLGNKIGVFKILETIFTGINMAFSGIKAMFEWIDEMTGKGKGNLFEKMLNWLNPFLDTFAETIAKGIVQMQTPLIQGAIPATAGMSPGARSGGVTNINIDQKITATGDAGTVKKAVSSGTSEGIKQAGAQTPSIRRKN